MNGYVDLQAEAEREWETRHYRRRLWLASIRGCLRLKASPRWLVYRAFLLSAIPGIGVAWLLHRLGLSWRGPAPALGVVVMWPVFVCLMWWTAGTLFHELRLWEYAKSYARHDESLDVEGFWHQYAPRSEWREAWHEHGSRSLSQAVGRALGQGGLPVLLVIGLVTAGTWIVWQMVKHGPTLLAELIFDGYLEGKQTNLARHATLEPWVENILVSTAVYFLFLAIIVLTLGAIVGCFPTAGWGRP